MLYFTIALLSAFLVALVGASGLRLRERIRRPLARSVPAVDDEAVDRILETGILEGDGDEPEEP